MKRLATVVLSCMMMFGIAAFTQAAFAQAKKGGDKKAGGNAKKMLGMK